MRDLENLNLHLNNLELGMSPQMQEKSLARFDFRPRKAKIKASLNDIISSFGITKLVFSGRYSSIGYRGGHQNHPE